MAERLFAFASAFVLAAGLSIAGAEAKPGHGHGGPPAWAGHGVQAWGIGPPGWSHGRKVGWRGRPYPPGYHVSRRAHWRHSHMWPYF